MNRRRPRIPGTARLTVVVDERYYTAPRVGEVEGQGRVIRRARCGHDVYVSEQGLDAIGRRGKRLMCGPCMAARAGEHGARTGVYWFDDGGPEAA